MKSCILLLVGSLLFITACGRDEPVSYLVPKEEAVAAPVPSMKTQSATPAAQMAPPASTGYTAELPEGWTEVPGSGMRKVSYKIDGTSIDFYLISLSMGDVTSNVNRWRGQVSLGEATAEAIAEDVETLKVEGHEADYIEIYNEEGGKGIIAAIVDLAPQYWYFTGKGSVDELKAHAADIRAFLTSIKFDGHNH